MSAIFSLIFRDSGALRWLSGISAFYTAAASCCRSLFFFILLRYSFLLFSMPRFIFLVYSAVKWLLPRKVFLLQGNLFDALVSRQRFDYFRTFVLPHRFYFCRVKFLLCVALSVLELYFRAPILYRWLIFLCFFYCRVTACEFSTPFFFLPRKIFNILPRNSIPRSFCRVTCVAA